MDRLTELLNRGVSRKDFARGVIGMAVAIPILSKLTSATTWLRTPTQQIDLQEFTFTQPFGDDGLGWINNAIPYWRTPKGKSVSVISVKPNAFRYGGGTVGSVVFNLEQRAKATPNTTGTNISQNNMTADGSDNEYTNFGTGDVTMPADSILVFITGSSGVLTGVVDEVGITVTYMID